MKKFLITALFACLLSASAHAALRLGASFGEHMVLPRDVTVILWGTGAPGGDTVRVAIQGQTAVGTSDWSGRWMVQLKPLHAGGPFQMNIIVGGQGPLVPSSAANDTAGLEVNDVLVGDVLPASQLPATDSLNSAQELHPEAHPDAFVRVYSSSGSAWTLVRQEAIPPGLASFFRAGGIHYAATHVPIGVIAPATPTPCTPSTACSAH